MTDWKYLMSICIKKGRREEKQLKVLREFVAFSEDLSYNCSSRESDALWRQRDVESEFETSLISIMDSRPAKATY